MESCSDEPAAMKQVMVLEVREHSIPIHEKNGPSFSFMTAECFSAGEEHLILR